MLVPCCPVSLLTSFSRLSTSEQRELASRMERKQLKEFMTVCLRVPFQILANPAPDVLQARPALLR